MRFECYCVRIMYQLCLLASLSVEKECYNGHVTWIDWPWIILYHKFVWCNFLHLVFTSLCRLAIPLYIQFGRFLILSQCSEPRRCASA